MRQLRQTRSHCECSCHDLLPNQTVPSILGFPNRHRRSVAADIAVGLQIFMQALGVTFTLLERQGVVGLLPRRQLLDKVTQFQIGLMLTSGIGQALRRF